MHSYRFKRPRPRPSWWPENEPWPPVRHMRPSPFLRRMGCAFMLVNLIGLAILASVIVMVVRWLGQAHATTFTDQWLIPLGVAFALIVTLVFGLANLVMRRVAVPVDDLLKAADRVGQGDYSVRVEEKGPRDVRTLTRAFNDMAARLSETDEQRRALLADVTHELRNPLTVIQGNLEGMLDGIYPADETELRALMDETKILSRLVEDLRTLSLAESGALQLKKEPTDLAMLIRDTAASFLAQADTAGVTLSVEAAPDLTPVTLDPGRVRQVLSNLLTNALRYTPAGGIVAIRYRQSEGQALLEVQDSGPGIPADELPHVFERFYKSADSGGMGLGLAIARHLVEAHIGTIRAESAPGQGTTMRVEIPV